MLAPAAIENQITKDNADNIKADIVLELANGPTTFDADSILEEKGTIVVPDILANAGGVVSSYQEWVNNRVGGYFQKDAILKWFERIMHETTRNVYIESLKNKTSLRVTAYMLAIKRILEAERLRGRLK